jgi:hypothetical protein
MRNEEKLVTIYVEGTPHEVPMGKITYAQVVTLEVLNYPEHPEIIYTVKYKANEHSAESKILTKGDSVQVHPRMVFSVREAGQS